MNYSSEIEQEKKNKRKGMITSFVIHALLILLLWWLGLPYLDPPPPDEGILVNFGTTETGFGQQPSEVMEEVTEITPSDPTPTPPVTQQSEQEEVVTQEEEITAPVIKKEEVKKEVKKEMPVKETPKEPVKEPIKEDLKKEEPKVNERAMFTGKKSENNNPNNQGITQGKGDQGAKDGDPSSNNYGDKSYGKGDSGVGYDLGGRGKIALPLPEYNSQETGTVKVRIKVDQSGKVVGVEIEPKGTTTTSNTLKSAALAAARKARFTPDATAQEIQFGTITYTFKVQ
jgi:periplasmic protein TonB